MRYVFGVNDEGTVLLVMALGVVVTVIWAIYKAVAGTVGIIQDAGTQSRISAERSRQWVERRSFELFLEFPESTDVQIAQLVRDELLNARSNDRACYEWATPETAGRVRRTALLNYLRANRG